LHPRSIAARLDALIHDHALDQPACWRERLAFLDALELCDLDDAERTRFDALGERYRRINHRLYAELRASIEQGHGARTLWPLLSAAIDSCAADEMAADGYDDLDELVSGVLAIEPPDDAQVTQPAEMVFYQPTPVRHVVDLIHRLGLGEHDVLMDLGAGLGLVPLLVAICTDAECIGIEREAVYADSFRRCAQALSLTRAQSVQLDARDADLSRATVFYLYTPFTGTVMRQMLDRLRVQASLRSFRIACFGPCSSVIADESWLEPAGPIEAGRIHLFVPRATAA
jgi:hypothetical protein